MNSSAQANRGFMNSLLPRNSPQMQSQPQANSAIAIILSLIAFSLFVAGMFYFKDQISDTWKNTLEVMNGYFGVFSDVSGNKDIKDISGSAAPVASPLGGIVSPAPPLAGTSDYSTAAGSSVYIPSAPYPMTASSSMNKILPGGKTEVFNVSSNKYTYYDAEPLCKALGAELATYDQMKDALSKGADWCNYGWVKGQLAVYPTSDATYAKIQAGPPDQLGSCGQPGMNGGYFDNPEMRFGVNCYGKKPPKTANDEVIGAQGAPPSPETIAFDKKVNQFKQDADNVAILPFNSNSWE
jgi:hypothetical protein